MFGSSFFLVQSCSTAAVPAPCILAVNQNGLNFLSTETHVSGSAQPRPTPPPRDIQLHCSHLRDLGRGSAPFFLTWDDDAGCCPGETGEAHRPEKPVWLYWSLSQETISMGLAAG